MFMMSAFLFALLLIAEIVVVLSVTALVMSIINDLFKD